MIKKPINYRFPVLWAIHWLLGAFAGTSRDAGADANTLLAARHASARVRGAAHIPERGPFILVTNHYERAGMRMWWSALFLSLVLREARAVDTPRIRWLMSEQFYGYRLGPVPVPDTLIRWLLRLIARRYDMIPVPRTDSRDTAARSRAFRLARRALTAGHPVGLTPEAESDSRPGGVLVEPGPDRGLAVALLSRGELPIVPIAVFEDGATLVAHVGTPYTLERGEPPALRDRVMCSIAELLPAELRGPYGSASPSPIARHA